MLNFELTMDGLEETLKDFKKFGKKLSKPQLAQIAIDQIARIKERTLSGKDYKGQNFTPYSASWARQRGIDGYQTSHVDLKESGDMYGAMTHQMFGNNAVLIYFAGDELQSAKAHGLHYGYPPHKLPPRPFFEFSDQDEKDAKEDYEAIINSMVLEYFG